MRLSTSAIALLLLAGFPLVASSTTIADVVANGVTFSGQTVSVTGTVTGPLLNGAGETTFNVQDANGQRLSVFGKGLAPAAGASVSVTGVVGYKAPNEEFVWPPVLHAATW